MRGTWDTAEPSVLQPGQREQHQQQQKTIVEKQRHPLHSSTTPAWGIADRIVKEEPIEDRNNDSGVSPGHYTSNSVSPRSRRSSSTANGSPSPGSATSQDLSAMECSTFEYSPQSIYRPCDSPVELSRLNGIHETSSHQPDLVSSSRTSSGEDIDNQDMLSCPFCVFTTTDRLQFTQHLAAHCKSKSDNSSQQQQSEDSGNRSSPARSDPSEHRSDEADEPGVRVPRINSQGKVKTFRCKQCNFVAITKLEFWEHSRIHIKAEKLLTCPKCPFVTEFKHHLEYHLRNHTGSKPFKCDQCPYSCVNKSMLNSHLKSHSNVYQYRCANCSYATKYCHSLKLHLRKYSHNPAMVLNADGSPNPNPIIDVYGTRRGPKQKLVAKGDEQSHQIMARQAFQHRTAASPSPQVAPAQVSPVNHLVVNPVSNPMAMINPVQSSMIAAFPYNQLFGGFHLPGHFMVTDETSEKQMEYSRSAVWMECARAMNAGCENVPEQFPQAVPNLNAIGGANVVNGMKGANEIDAARDTAATSTTTEYENMEMETGTNDRDKVTPLDLSKPENTPVSSIGQVANSPRTTGTSRRKGRAVKLERRVLKTELEDDVEEMERVSKPQAASSTDGGSEDAKETAVKKLSGVGMSNEFSCQYCDMAFRDIAMYTIHMGYHGYKDPYTCNMCGHKCTDKLSFFIHMAQSKHS